MQNIISAVFLWLYRAFCVFLTPAYYIFLKRRIGIDKEDPLRFREKLGIYVTPRPNGKVIWIHAASVGEVNSVLMLVQILSKHANVLITSCTKTSQNLLASKNLNGVIAQYAVLDNPIYIKRFLKHWKPDVFCVVESECWPNLFAITRKHVRCMLAVNTRFSPSSMRKWLKYPSLFCAIYGKFDEIFPQSSELSSNLAGLGIRNEYVGNLKYDIRVSDCSPLDIDFFGKKIILFASTHAGEEEIIANNAHDILKSIPNAIIIIAIRHPHRSSDVRNLLMQSNLSISVRSQNEVPTRDTQVYLVDTIGELMSFYQVCHLAIVCGNFVDGIGGHNPLEPAYFSKPIVVGPYCANCAEMVLQMSQSGAIFESSVKNLASDVAELIGSEAKMLQLAQNANRFLVRNSGATHKISEFILSKL